ncbi:MAG: twitch domain-containing radical SAM protein [Synechococcaceae bacterium WB8_1B_057]|nr:twitch domain-containing radical SAM protein [Synechococcaceae bacterium WB8_1B_057]
MKFDTDKKKFLLEKSRTFCMVPWITIHTKPVGDAMPCCIANPEFIVGTSHKQSLMEIVNSPLMNRLRLDMLNERESKPCVSCYKHEDEGIHTFRNTVNKEYGQYFTESLKDTKPDGSLKNFKMRYFDIRFDNICNFKCRTCGSEFSSQWAKENRRYDKNLPILWHSGHGKNDLLKEILTHVDHIDLAYFAGGEPLITEEHYILLEEMIRKNKTDVILRYNTNASNLKFKDFDILSLWKNFKRIELSCSVDHYGSRAEYIRHGTNWGEVESNLLLFRKLDFVDFQINTVLSIFNFMTLHKFYEYMINMGLIKPSDWYHSLYLAVNPSHYSSTSLPRLLKKRIKNKHLRFLDYCEGTLLERLIKDAVNFTNEQDTWEENKETFWRHTKSIDVIRGESFLKTFPELKDLEDL